MELKIDKLSFSYSQEKTILKNVSLAVEQGEILGVLGMHKQYFNPACWRHMFWKRRYNET